MGRFLQMLGLQESVTETVDDGTVATLEYREEKLRESLAQLQLAMEDMGWSKLGSEAANEFTREGLKRSAELSRMMAVGNPLIKRGLAIRASYVHGQGVGITARADGDEGAQDVNAVIQEFLDDDTNRAALTGHQAKLRNETSLGTDGNVFIALFTNPLTGRVQARTLPFDEIEDKISVDGDRMVTMYYKRVWTEGTTTKTAYYPDIRYRPITRLKRYGASPGVPGSGHPIMWDSPVYHLNDNGLEGWKFGIGDAYAALPWARAYKEFLEDWTLLVKALSKIAFRASAKKTPASQQARAALQKMPDMPAGNTAFMSPDATLEAVPKTGATIDSESGRPVATMVAAALGLPVTTLMADPGQTGARAVAETLTQPTVLEFKGRQELWTECFRAILGYVIDQAVMAPRGPLKGTVTRDTNTLTVALAGDTDRTLDFAWPDINELPVETIMKALEIADGTGKIPPLVLARLMLRALGVRDVDEILEDMTDENGDFIDPNMTAGQAAVDAFRRGEGTEALR